MGVDKADFLIDDTMTNLAKARIAGQRIVIAGGSGFLGLSMAEHMANAGAEVTILSRSTPKTSGRWLHSHWDGRSLGDWAATLDGAHTVVNVAGRTVNCIKTPDHQDEILRSRVESTRVLDKAMRAVKTPPAVWAQMSTAHIYGDWFPVSFSKARNGAERLICMIQRIALGICQDNHGSCG